MHYKHACAFLKVNKLLKIFAITVDAQNVSLLFINNSVLKMCPPIHVAVLASGYVVSTEML
jgi:6-phosphogluconolactonase (cycloisomerase 2 family)